MVLPLQEIDWLDGSEALESARATQIMERLATDVIVLEVFSFCHVHRSRQRCTIKTWLYYLLSTASILSGLFAAHPPSSVTRTWIDGRGVVS